MIREPFQISANDLYRFEAGPDEARNLDIIPDGAGKFHLLLDGKTYHAELLDADYAARRITLRVNGTKYAIDIADHYERLVQQLGLAAGSAQKVNTIKAPMPGLVLNILAEPGREVQKGDPLIILEAMKMENVIKATGEGRIKAVKVAKGAAVEKGQLLIELE